MNWISKLLNKTDARSSASSSPPVIKAAIPAEALETMRGALITASDGEEREQLAIRLGQALAERSQAPHAEDPPGVWVAALCHAPDKALALSWLAGVSDDAWLGEVATQARSAEIRFAAVQRIATSEVLEQVANGSRDKDKRVYRHCADLLRQRRQAEESARRALEIADEVRRLLDTAPLPHTRLLDLKKELSSLKAAGEPGVQSHALLEQAFTRLRQESEALRDLHAQQQAAAALVAECAGAAWPWSEQIDPWRARVDSLKQAQVVRPSWLAEHASARALGTSLGEIETRLVVLAADDERALACDQFLIPFEAGMTPAADTAAAWEALAKPRHPDARAALAARWQALSASAPHVVASEPAPAPPPPQPRRRIDQDAVRELLDKLDQAIVQGHLVDADMVAKQIKATLGGNSLHGELESRLHGLQAQLEVLRGWARWGTGQAREKLIEAARELLAGEHEVDVLAQAITALRDEWKHLNAHGAAAKGQWEKFDATLEQAYQPVAVHRAAEAARQAEARAAKEALCAGWEAELAGIVWEQADFKAVEARCSELLKQWRAAPQAGFRDERALRKRFDTLIGGIEQRLNAVRAAESARREQIIVEAEALTAQPDLRLAMAAAKALQQRWSQQEVPVRLKRGDEQKLWHRFRAACDLVFARLDAQRAEQMAARQQQADSRQSRLDAFAAALVGADANSIKRALSQFRADWGTPATREAADSLETRARALQQQAQQRLDELRNEKNRERFEQLARKAALAEGVEAAALAGQPLEQAIAEANQAWGDMPPLPGKVESLLAKRLATAGSVTRAQLAAGRETREALLLDLEIALALPSPLSYAEARRERQLERLQGRFGANMSRDPEPEEMLARWYASAALPDAEFDQRIAAVVRKLAQQTVPVSGG